MLTVRCTCGKTIRAKDKFAGKTVRCPGCQQPLRIPEPEAEQDGADLWDEMADYERSGEDIKPLPLPNQRPKKRKNGNRNATKNSWNGALLAVSLAHSFALILLMLGAYKLVGYITSNFFMKLPYDPTPMQFVNAWIVFSLMIFPFVFLRYRRSEQSASERVRAENRRDLILGRIFQVLGVLLLVLSVAGTVQSLHEEDGYAMFGLVGLTSAALTFFVGHWAVLKSQGRQIEWLQKIPWGRLLMWSCPPLGLFIWFLMWLNKPSDR